MRTADNDVSHVYIKSITLLLLKEGLIYPSFFFVISGVVAGA